MNLINKAVKVVFANGSILEGTVIDFNGSKAIIRTYDNQAFMIIPNIEEHVLLIKVLSPFDSPEEYFKEAPEEYMENDQQNLEMKDRIKKLTQHSHKEKQQIANHLNQSPPDSSAQGSNYEFPNFKKRSPFVRPTAKINRRP